MIQLKAGRIDATAPNDPSVLQPNGSFDLAKAAFANAGFSQTDMI
jgi:hypothetical protein